jgi:5-(carboxyamino)imidazole ribonucleotide mutase
MPDQKVVLILGSKSDIDFSTEITDALKNFDISYECNIASAHKTPEYLLGILNKYEKSDNTIVYITVAGLSDALSGFVAGVSDFPVISCPPDSRKLGWQKIFSSVMTPRSIAVLFVNDPENAALASAKILALSNSSMYEKIHQYREMKKKDVIFANKMLKREIAD